MKYLSPIFAAVLLAAGLTISANGQADETKPTVKYDEKLAKQLGADERGMRMFVLCILKTGPKDAEIKGKERDNIFTGHFANIGNLASQGKLAVAGPLKRTIRRIADYIFLMSPLSKKRKNWLSWIQR